MCDPEGALLIPRQHAEASLSQELLANAYFDSKITKQIKKIPEQYVAHMLDLIQAILWYNFTVLFDTQTPALVTKLTQAIHMLHDESTTVTERQALELPLQELWGEIRYHVIHITRIMMDIYSLARQLRIFHTEKEHPGTNVVVAGHNHIWNYTKWLNLFGAKMQTFTTTNLYPACKEDVQTYVRLD